MASSRWLTFGKRLVGGCLIAAVLTVALVIAAEAILRVSHFGHPPGFWRIEKDSEGRPWVRENWWVTAPFFSPELMRRPQAFRLAETKAPDAYRIFVLGSSAAMGDPEPSFSISRVLETELRAAYPQVKFEVVNAGVTAINSHVVRGIAADCAQLHPDLFIVYEGNNEVIGPFGPATVFTPVLRRPFAIHAAIFLRGLRVGQWLTQRTHRETKSVSGPDEWGGMQMFLQHQIAADDPRLGVTRDLFEDNLRSIAKSGTDAGASVLLCTVLTNEKDFAPFQSWHTPNLAPERVLAWENAKQAAEQSEKIGDWIGAEDDWRGALAIDNAYAETHFQLGRSLLALGRASDAKPEFQKALDLDVLRFRTDSSLNRAIREVAASAGSNVKLVDLVEGAEKQSPLGILGDEFLYEHVHLNLHGTYVVAQQLFTAVTQDLVKRGRIRETDVKPEPISIEDVRIRLAYTTYEQAMILKDLLGRFQRAPFTAQSDDKFRIAAYERRDRVASQILSRPDAAASIFAIYDQAIAANPDDWVLHRNYGMALAAMKRSKEAKGQLERALEIIPDDPDSIYSLIVAQLDLGEKTEAEKRIAQLKRLEPRYPGLERLR